MSGSALFGLDRRALSWASGAVLLNIAAIYFGSGRMARFDPALIAYTCACIFATFGVVYRYGVWLEKPPTALYWKRGWKLFLRPSHFVKNCLHLITLAWNSLIAQTFIEKRSHTRWVAHFLISWGFLIACAVTFPLVFGWVAFEADPSDPAKYITFVFGFAVLSFPAHSLFGWIIFHILDFCAVAILIGMGFAFKRRLYDPGALSVQQFANDFFPLILLFAVCLTGLMLTASAVWMQGHNYSFLATLHAFSVITTLLYLPFGKFFHVFQRPANIGVQFYKEEGKLSPRAHCRVCGADYASQMQVEDLMLLIRPSDAPTGTWASESLAGSAGRSLRDGEKNRGYCFVRIGVFSRFTGMKSSRRNLIDIAIHLVWTTYERRPLVTEVLERSVYRCIEAEAVKLGCAVLAIGGMPDHVHVVLMIPSTTSLANLMKQMKGVSSSLVKDLLPNGFFKWADGYAAFSLSSDHCQNAIAYVHRQKEHHTEKRSWPRWERTPEPFSPTSPVAE